MAGAATTATTATTVGAGPPARRERPDPRARKARWGPLEALARPVPQVRLDPLVRLVPQARLAPLAPLAPQVRRAGPEARVGPGPLVRDTSLERVPGVTRTVDEVTLALTGARVSRISACEAA